MASSERDWSDQLPAASGDEDVARLRQENGYLRASLQQMRSVAAENLDLLQHVARLEHALELSGVKPPQMPSLLGRAQAQLKSALESRQSGSSGGAVVDGLVNRILPANEGETPVLIVGPANVDPTLWPIYGLSELTNICFGMVTDASLCFVCGPLRGNLSRRLDPLRQAYGVQIGRASCRERVS
jgi:hypothetical protein